eukprot:TRINITY_DN4620_c0_g1_i1.p1 TRINITY_DN4620_c0_g1~~TRINITY_DN4620_c0_g1_i1.p1  ORF type:complete len:189 (+),score=47.04 TRINITY_DN4620_c0_g1_i1:63-629(+)
MKQEGFVRGTNVAQDTTLSAKEPQKRKFPPEYNLKVDMSKVNLNVIKKWLARRVTELLDIEDEVLINYIESQLEEQNPDPKQIEISLIGFLGKSSADLVHELWGLLLDAQDHGGIPLALLEKKKQEIQRRRVRFILSRCRCEVVECAAISFTSFSFFQHFFLKGIFLVLGRLKGREFFLRQRMELKLH